MYFTLLDSPTPLDSILRLEISVAIPGRQKPPLERHWDSLKWK